MSADAVGTGSHWLEGASGGSPSGSNVEQVVPFFWVRDIRESLRFYVDGLGFTKTREWIDGGRVRWCWLKLGGAAIMLQQSAAEQQQLDMSPGRVDHRVIHYFICQDALTI